MELITTHVTLDKCCTTAATAVSDSRGILTALSRENQLLRLRVSFLNEHADIEASALHAKTCSAVLNNPQTLARAAHEPEMEALVYDLQGCGDYAQTRNEAMRRRAITTLEEVLIAYDLPCDLTSILETTQTTGYDVNANGNLAQFTFTPDNDGSLTMTVRSTGDHGFEPSQKTLHITAPEIIADITKDIFIWREADYSQIAELMRCSHESPKIIDANTTVDIVYQTLTRMDNYWATTTRRTQAFSTT